MSLEKRKNSFGGSASGGGYDFQAEAYALVASKILAEEGLNWPETGCDRLPVSVRVETGKGGDDLCITLRSGATIELQAKRGLKRGDDLWSALLALAQVVTTAPSIYGVLLTNGEASGPIRVHLREGIIRIGQGTVDAQHEIVEDFCKRLQAAGFKDLSICSRLRIVIRDLDPESSGEEETLATLRKVIADHQMAGAARTILVADGLDLIKLRGNRDASGLAKVLKQACIPLSVATRNQLVLREVFTDWCTRMNETIVIPSLDVTLPISQAWVRLRAMAPKERMEDSTSIADQIRNYHEWYRLAGYTPASDTLDIEKAIRNQQLLVILGGPGSGKSTLLRWLAHRWSTRGQVVLRVSLRALALRMSRGETIDEAILAIASEGFPHEPKRLDNVLRNASCLLADGLDETDPNRSDVADKLRRWALAHTERRVVITTRPVGHNPAWFDGWEHYELLPLGSSDISELAETVFNLVYQTDPEQAQDTCSTFLQILARSRTASIASRNPQLLGFLIALHIKGSDIGGNRVRLFSKVVDEIGKHTRRDREFHHTVEWAIAQRVLECLGWWVQHNPGLSEEALLEFLGQHLAEELGIQPLRAQLIAWEAVAYWEERGLLEKLRIANMTTFTFVHMAFHEFAAAKFLARLPGKEFVESIRSKYNMPQFRETLLFTGGTKRLGLAVTTLLDIDDPSDPVSTAALFAADVLAEAEEPPLDLRDRVFQYLTPRLVSNVPMVVYEAGERLRPIALANPAVIGPLALELSRHGQQWTRGVACALALLCGDDYVNVDALLEVFPIASDSGFRSGRRRGIVIGEVKPLMRHLIIQGAKYLLRETGLAWYLDIVKEQARNPDLSWETLEDLLDVLAGYLPIEELQKIRPTWFARPEVFHNADVQQAVREADQVLLETILVASEGLIHDERSSLTDPRMGSLARLYQALDIGHYPWREMYAWRRRPLQEALVEVIRGAILVNSLDPAQVKADAEQALCELVHPQNDLLRLIRDSLEFDSEIQMNWTLGQGQQLQPNLLLRAMSHPSWSVSKFAAQLLWECVERALVCTGLKEVLAHGSGYALAFIAANATEIWQEEPADLVLDRLERNLTEDCTPLVKILGELCRRSSQPRAEVVLQHALQSRDAKMVYTASHAIEKLNLGRTLSTTIRDCYRWWLHEGPQDSIPGIRVYEHPAASLLSLLIANGQVSFAEVREAAHVRLPGIHDVAIKAIGQFLAEADELVEPTIDDIRLGNLPCRFVTELAGSYPDVCSRHFDSFLGLLDSDDSSLQTACIWALTAGWAEKGKVQGKLRSLLNTPDAGVRDVVVEALRRLSEV
jgi:energy-coupling factor transporter ATP-binding protein EcfA2